MRKACVIAPLEFNPPHCRINDEINILKANSYDVKLVLASSSRSTKTHEIIDNLEIFRYRYEGFFSFKIPILNSIFMTLRLFFKAKELDANVYHCHDYQTSHVAFLLSLSGKKVIYDIGDDSPSNHKIYFRNRVSKNPFLGNFIEKSIRYLEGKVMRKCAITLSLSNTMRDDRLTYTKKIKVLKYSPNYIPKSFPDKSVLLESNYIIYQGAISEEKGIFEIFEAIEKITYLGKDIKLIIAGYKSDESWNKIKKV